MNQKWRRLGGSLIAASVLEMMLFFPIVLAVFALKPPPGSITLALDVLILLAYYWLGYGINALLKFKHAFPKLLLALIISGVCSFLLFGLSGGTIALAVLGIAAAYRGGRYPGMPLSFRLLSQDYIIGVLCYFVGAIMDSVNHTFADFRPLYLGAGIVTLFAALFLTNRNMVGRETLSGAEKPVVEPSVRRNNRIYVSVALVVTVLIGFAFQMQKLIGDAGRALLDMLLTILRHQPKPRDASPQGDPNPINFPAEVDKAKPHPAWIDNIMYVLVALIILGVLYLISRRLNLLPAWLKELRNKLFQLFQRDRSQTARGYVDEIERIKKNENPFRRLFARSKEERLKWKDLHDNETRLRYLYRRWIGTAVKQGFAHQAHLTPQEIRRQLGENRIEPVPQAVTDALIEQYQHVRYGGGKLSDEQLQALAAKLGQTKS